jgi:hypothetical protein
VEMDTRVGVETTGTETVARTEAEMAGKTTTVNSASVVIHCFVAAISAAARWALGRANRGLMARPSHDSSSETGASNHALRTQRL